MLLVLQTEGVRVNRLMASGGRGPRTWHSTIRFLFSSFLNASVRSAPAAALWTCRTCRRQLTPDGAGFQQCCR